MSTLLKAFALALIVCCTNVNAQSVTWQTITKTIITGGVDTVFFAFRPVGVFSATVSPDSVPINPPDKVAYAGDGTVTIRKVAGSATDSTVSYAKGFDHNGRIIQGDSVMVAGSSFAAPALPNTIGNGKLYGASIANLKKYINGVLVITKIFDTVGDSTRYEYQLGSY